VGGRCFDESTTKEASGGHGGDQWQSSDGNSATHAILSYFLLKYIKFLKTSIVLRSVVFFVKVY
jgi:hypothetical protein